MGLARETHFYRGDLHWTMRQEETGAQCGGSPMWTSLGHTTGEDGHGPLRASPILLSLVALWHLRAAWYVDVGADTHALSP